MFAYPLDSCLAAWHNGGVPTTTATKPRRAATKRSATKPFVSLAPRYQREFLDAKCDRMGVKAFLAEQAEDERVAAIRRQCKPMSANSHPLVASAKAAMRAIERRQRAAAKAATA